MAESLVLQEWNVWETQIMVLLSFMLQLFLLSTGSLRRRHISGLLRALIWLSYMGADVVAVYALGLFSQYEDKYRLGGREAFANTLPFLWVPFLLVHLGGQDSISAFSLEDNNLWLRHLLNLGTQGVLALYVLWKSFDRISVSILVPAMLVFVSGIIKYGERVWALKNASRDSLIGRSSPNFMSLVRELGSNDVTGSKEWYARLTVLLARGLFVGRTVLQVGAVGPAILDNGFKKCQGIEEKLKMVAMELNMMFNLLYTKAIVLQRSSGVLFRCASQALMVVALVLFMIRREEGAHNNKVNVAITYTLFSGAIFVETCCVAAAIASHWTRAHLENESSYLHGLYNFATSFFGAIHQCNKRHKMTLLLSTTATLGQFNLMDYCFAMNSQPRVFSYALSFIGLGKQWRNSWYVHHIDDAGGNDMYWWIINRVLEYLATSSDDDLTHTLPPHHPAAFGQLHVRRLNSIFSLPFEDALYRLHLYTDLHLSRHFNNCSTSSVVPPPPEIMRLKEECETLSNYMMYLMVMHPSMLPVSMAAGDLQPKLLRWVTGHLRHGSRKTKLSVLEIYTRSEFEFQSGHIPGAGSPFEPEQNGSFHLQHSLTQIKEMWVRLLMYAAGKCGGELHARQLGEGGELITFVWLLMLHHGVGDVARELSLLRPNHPNVVERGLSFVSSARSPYEARYQEPFYAFNLHYEQAEHQ
ncbi:hypothetical protein Zm00014a_028988 [Zea mays]|uniref:DUF4220 domain-containing protein n=1 Tax=Zea mays TaxID=4577 RepID=A0A3L6G723_MAIZE|nr:hypothetical protein Zm00014a_028988 [Zea mays]